MNGRPLSSGVLVLLRDKIESFEQLEVLLLIRQDEAKLWTVESIHTELGMDSAMVAEALAHLRAGDLVQLVPGGALSQYRYTPGTPELAEAVAELADAYRDRQIEVMRLLGANAVDRVRTKAIRLFADAFLIGGRGKKDG